MSELIVASRKRVLDIGCGSGWVLAKGGVRHSQGLWVGIDLSHVVLLEGSRRFRRLHFAEANALALPFRDASFDEVIGHVSLPYMNTRAALREIARVLVPGGMFFFTVHSLAYVRNRLITSARHGRARDVLFMLHVAANGLLSHYGLPQLPWFGGKFETCHTATGVSRIAKRVGLSVVRLERLPGLVFFAVTGRKPGRAASNPSLEFKWSLSVVVQTNSDSRARSQSSTDILTHA